MKKVRFYHGRFGPYIPLYLRKRLVEGYKIEIICPVLEQFCRYLKYEFQNPKIITKKIIIDWFSKERLWSPSTSNNNVGIIRGFIKFLESRGVRCWDFSHATSLYKKRVEFIPHIYNKEELKLMFQKLDSWPFNAASPFKHLALPLMFRFLINFGLRVGEVCNIKIKDISADVLTVRDSKTRIKRFIPINASLLEKVNNYKRKVHLDSSEDENFFLFDVGKPINDYYLETSFRELLYKCKMPHGGKSKGPRLYDFRHTYVVYRMRQWLEEGRDLLELAPYITRFLGHKNFNQTIYYFSFVADLFPDFRELEDALYRQVFPYVDMSEVYD